MRSVGVKFPRDWLIKMSLVVDDGIVGIGMRIVILRKEDCGAEIHRMSPEFCQHGTLEFYDFDPLRFFWRRELGEKWTLREFVGGNDFVHGEGDVETLGWIEMNFLNCAIRVAGCERGKFTDPIEMGPDGVAIGAVKLGVNVQKRFDVVISRGEIFEARERIAGSRSINGDFLSRREIGDVLAEKWWSAFGEELDARILPVRAGDDDEDAAGDGLRMI